MTKATTVQELIEILQELDPDATLALTCGVRSRDRVVYLIPIHPESRAKMDDGAPELASMSMAGQ